MEDIRKKALEKLLKGMEKDYEKGCQRAFELMEKERIDVATAECIVRTHFTLESAEGVTRGYDREDLSKCFKEDPDMVLEVLEASDEFLLGFGDAIDELLKEAKKQK